MIHLIKVPFLLKNPFKNISHFQIAYFSSSNSNNPSFYEILDIDPNCSLQEIKQAYYKKGLKSTSNLKFFLFQQNNS